MDYQIRPGDKIGSYDVLGPLGKGAMGAVYRVRDRFLEKERALKFPAIDERLSGDEQRHFNERFIKEAKLHARLDHPNIVRVLGAGTHETTSFSGKPLTLPYFVMELVEGGNELYDWYRSSPPPFLEDIATVFRGIAAGLEHAHKNEILHRDIKSTNILVTADGEAKLIDFGLARTSDDEQGITRTGFALGTAPYWAPEYFNGPTPTHTKLTDLWAVGCTFYECLTQRQPFPAPNVHQRIQMILSETLEHCGAIRRDASPELCDIVHRLLVVNPQNRLQSAKDLHVRLRALGSSVRNKDVSFFGPSPTPVAPLVAGSDQPTKHLGPSANSKASLEQLESLDQFSDLRPADAISVSEIREDPPVAQPGSLEALGALARQFSGDAGSNEAELLSIEREALQDESIAVSSIVQAAQAEASQSIVGDSVFDAFNRVGEGQLAPLSEPVEPPKAVSVAGDTSPASGSTSGVRALAQEESVLIPPSFDPVPAVEETSGRKLPLGMIAGGVALAVIVGFFLFTGGGDNDADRKTRAEQVVQAEAERVEAARKQVAETNLKKVEKSDPRDNNFFRNAEKPKVAVAPRSLSVDPFAPEAGTKEIGLENIQHTGRQRPARGAKTKRAGQQTAKVVKAPEPASDDPWAKRYGTQRNLNTSSLGTETTSTGKVAAVASKGLKIPVRLLSDITSPGPVIVSTTSKVTVAGVVFPAGTKIHGRVNSLSDARAFAKFTFAKVKGKNVPISGSSLGKDSAPGIPAKVSGKSKIVSRGAAAATRVVGGALGAAAGPAGNVVGEVTNTTAQELESAIESKPVTTAKRSTRFFIYLDK